METQNRRRGLLFMLVAVLMFSIGGLCIKQVTWQPMAVSGGRSLISTFVIGGYMLAVGHKPVFNRQVALGSAAMFLTATLFVVATKLTTAANAVVLQYTAPVFLMLYSAVFFHRKLARLDIITCGTVMAGIVCFFLESLSAGGMLGNILAVVAGASYAVLCMLGEIPGNDPVSCIFFGQLLSAAVGSPFILAETDFSPSNIIPMLLLGVFQLGLAYVFYYKGLELLRSIDVCLMGAIEPVLNPVLVAVFYGEKVSAGSAAAGLVVIGAIAVYNIIENRKPRRQAGRLAGA